MTSAQKSFISKILPGALKAQSKYGILASLTLAQACLESNWGSSAPGNMLFGIKWTLGCGYGSQLLKTTEYYSKTMYGKIKASGAFCELIGVTNGKYYVRVKAKFRKYDNFSDSILDHSKLLLNTRYKDVISALDYIEACEQISECGYATDINYTSSLLKLIEANNLQQYDLVKVPKMTLQKDLEGSAVRVLQRQLNLKGYHLTVDGRFGNMTTSAVKDYQMGHGLIRDGIVGAKTKESLFGGVA